MTVEQDIHEKERSKQRSESVSTRWVKKNIKKRALMVMMKMMKPWEQAG